MIELSSQTERPNFDEWIREARFDDEAELREIARLYENVPVSWDPSYQATAEGIERTFRWLKEKRATLRILVAEKGSALAAIHVVGLQENRADVCLIKTLWVAPAWRRMGLASRLKTAGEKWARSRGAKTMVTHVMLKNPRMIEINQKRGFAPVKLELEKPL